MSQNIFDLSTSFTFCQSPSPSPSPFYHHFWTSSLSMATLRHGAPAAMQGWVFKEAKFFKSKQKRYLKLRGSVLSNHHNEASPATWEINVVDCEVNQGSKPKELIIHLPQRKTSFFAPTDAEYKQWIDSLKAACATGVDDFYELGKILGEGAFAQVREAKDKSTGELVAVKVIKKQDFDPKEMEFILREVNIMKSVSHPNIVNTYDVFDSKNELNLVLEYMKGGELFDVIAEEGRFSEKKASAIFRQLLDGIGYLHLHGIVHRDIKPENVLCKTKEWPFQVKLADFGLANFLEEETGSTSDKDKPSSMIGTPGYVAPEIVKREPYDTRVDMWSLGVLLYIMLSGKMPFFGRDDIECLKKIAAGKYSFPSREWDKISEDAKSLVKSLLQLDPEKRLTAKAALNHRWMDINTVSDMVIENDFSGIHSSKRKFKRAVHTIMTVERMKGIMNLQA